MKDVLLDDIQRIITANIRNDRFSVGELSRAVGMSRSRLNRRLNKLTGRSISQYIREFRLQEALRLMRETDLTASEISYEVGFHSPTYFNTCFHDYFGHPPGEVKKGLESDNPFPDIDLIGMQNKQCNVPLAAEERLERLPKENTGSPRGSRRISMSIRQLVMFAMAIVAMTILISIAAVFFWRLMYPDAL